MPAAREDIRDFLRRERATILVQVTGAAGSTPRDTDAFMLVSEREIFATIGGRRYIQSLDEAFSVIELAKVEDSIARLRGLVEAESSCCSFVDWRIEEQHSDLRLVVTGSPQQLAALNEEPLKLF